jgi:hypothetical protein
MLHRMEQEDLSIKFCTKMFFQEIWYLYIFIPTAFISITKIISDDNILSNLLKSGFNN